MSRADECIEIARNAQHRLTVAQTGQPLHLFSESLLLCLRPTRLGSIDADDTYHMLADHHPYCNDPPLPSLLSFHFLADLHIHDDTNTITHAVSSSVQHRVSLRHLPCPVSVLLRLCGWIDVADISPLPVCSTLPHTGVGRTGWGAGAPCASIVLFRGPRDW